MERSWKFEKNEFDISEGPNDPGISGFTNDRAGGLVREFLQNSIDARKSDEKPVEVSFKIVNLPIADFDIDGLIRAFEASCKSPDNDDRHKKQFQRGLKMLKAAKRSGYLSALVVTDSNTTGAPDIDRLQDKWRSLTKSVGKSNKDAADSGGSFGIGKHAAFAATDIRSVLYATAYLNGGSIERRFTGKTILVSHELQGKSFKATGYLEGVGVPKSLQLQSPGTAIAILGFPSNSASLRTWKNAALESLVANFFHAFGHKNLIVHLLDRTIDHNILDAVVDSVKDDKSRDLVAVSKSEIASHTDIDGIGRVNLRIHVDKDNKNQGKALALVRDSGMLITAQLGNMHISRSQSMVSFPRSWYGFTAIVECLSQGERSLLREAEGPRHSEISPDNADDSDRADVQRCIRELGQWIRQEIESFAKPPEPSRTDNASEMADFLPLPGEGKPSQANSGASGVEVSKPIRSPILPAGLGIRGGGRRRGQDNLSGSSSDGDGGRHINTNRNKLKTRRRKRREDVQVAFHDVRRLPSSLTQWPDHTAKFAFDTQLELPKRIRLYAIGEDRRAEQLDIERAYFDGKRLKIRGGVIIELDEKRMGGRRIEIEIKAIRPIDGKRLEIRST